MTGSCDIEIGCGEKTDALKLKTVGGREYLLCKVCRNGGRHEGTSVSSESALSIPSAVGSREPVVQ